MDGLLRWDYSKLNQTFLLKALRSIRPFFRLKKLLKLIVFSSVFFLCLLNYFAPNSDSKLRKDLFSLFFELYLNVFFIEMGCACPFFCFFCRYVCEILLCFRRESRGKTICGFSIGSYMHLRKHRFFRNESLRKKKRSIFQIVRIPFSGVPTKELYY